MMKNPKESYEIEEGTGRMFVIRDGNREEFQCGDGLEEYERYLEFLRSGGTVETYRVEEKDPEKDPAPKEDPLPSADTPLETCPCCMAHRK